MRGTLDGVSACFIPFGIIPAYAGNTSQKARALAGARDHPRVCGEHVDRVDVDRIGLGSSPRMRGTHVDRIRLLGHLGIIPAYAGNTHLRAGDGRLFRDHPRVCGEHDNGETDNSVVTGSSPRMRGTRQWRN